MVFSDQRGFLYEKSALNAPVIAQSTEAGRAFLRWQPENGSGSNGGAEVHGFELISGTSPALRASVMTVTSGSAPRRSGRPQ